VRCHWLKARPEILLDEVSGSMFGCQLIANGGESLSYHTVGSKKIDSQTIANA
jgi:hypothetical protein